MPVPGVPVIEGERLPAGQHVAGDVATGLFVGPASRGAADRPIEISSPEDISYQLGEPYGGSHLYRSLIGFFTEGGAHAYVARAVDATAMSATVAVPDSNSAATVTVTADGPGAWANDLQVKVEAGTGTRTRVTILEDTVPKIVAEADTAEEAAQRLTTPGLVRVTPGPGVWPPAVTTANITLAGGAGDDSAVTDENVTTALGLLNQSLGSGTVLAPGYTSQDVHQALLDHARLYMRFALLDMPDIDDLATLTSQAAVERGYQDEKAGRYGMSLWPWEVVPLSDVMTVAVPPSGLQAGRMARTDTTDVQHQARFAAGPEVTSRLSVGVTRVPTDPDWDTLYTAGINVVRTEPEGICLMGSRTLVDADRWPQYTFAAGARVRMAIVDEARAKVRPFLFKALDGGGVRLETIRGTVENVCEPFSHEPVSGLFDVGGDHGYSVAIVSTDPELAQGKVRVQLALRTSPTIEMVVIEFTAVAIGDRL